LVWVEEQSARDNGMQGWERLCYGAGRPSL
jgi:hypothetical protein